jgi:hypothetical protein
MCGTSELILFKLFFILKYIKSFYYYFNILIFKIKKLLKNNFNIFLIKKYSIPCYLTFDYCFEVEEMGTIKINKTKQKRK